MAEAPKPETEGYDYRVLAVVSESDGKITANRRLAELGTFRARRPEDAIEAAVESGGLPSQRGGWCIAVPSSRWHEHLVNIKTEPVIEVSERAVPYWERREGESDGPPTGARADA